jgi:hypothetical protein
LYITLPTAKNQCKKMKKCFFTIYFILLVFMAIAQKKDDLTYFELRTYYCNPGKLPTLLTRFQDHTMRLFAKHNMVSIGYWVPIENTENKLVYLMAYPSKAARDASWDAFRADTEWQKVRAASEANGDVVAKIDSEFFTETDYSPFNLNNNAPRVFEIRRYLATNYNLPLLHARFRNHTLKLFEKQGIENIIYFNQTDSNSKLMYFLGHKSVEAFKTSFANFVADPDWLKAKNASETLANGSIVVEIKSEFLVPTSFSPLK